MPLDFENGPSRYLVFGFIHGQAEINIEPKQALDNFCARHNVAMSQKTKHYLLEAYQQFEFPDIFLSRFFR